MDDISQSLARRATAFSFTSLNWLLLVLCSVIVIVASFFLFYWNRLLGWLVGFLIRFLFWRRHNVWIECEAFQLSMLAGRVVLKDVHYHSRNTSVRAVDCHITWRYWLWRVQMTENLAGRQPPERPDPPHKNLDLPCRIHVVMNGLEVFLYNRTQAYDDLIVQLQARTSDSQQKPDGAPPSINIDPGLSEPGPSRVDETKERLTGAPPDESPKHEYPPQFIPSFGPLGQAVRGAVEWVQNRIPTLKFQDLLPIGIDASTCAVVIGNDSAPSVFIIEFSKASGTYGLAPSRSPLDEYKNVYAFKLASVKMITRQTPTLKSQWLKEELRFIRISLASLDGNSESFNFLSFDAFRRLARLHPNLIRRVTPKPAPKWRGLARYMTEAQKREAGEFAHELEYAKVTTLLETPTLEATYFVDVPGQVPRNPRGVESTGKETVDVGNGDLTPEWGVELILHGGSITWGPWADRQRDAVQKAMFPSSYTENSVSPRLKPGDLRQHTVLTFLLEIRDNATLRLPTRESSKDWRFDRTAAAADARRKKDKRPFGWIDITLGASSTLRYNMSIVSNEAGFPNSLEVHLLRPALSSSVNGARFLTTESCRILCKLPSPLKWNVHRQWVYDISFASPRIHLLRDHATLITDLISDWSSGPPSSFNTFVPVTYLLKFSLKDYRINLYINEHNIIDYPLADDFNSLLIFSGPSFESQVTIPSTRFRPYFSTIPFWIEASNVAIDISLPVWNTQRTFSTSHPISLGTLGLIRLDASNMTYSEIRDGNVEKLKLAFHARQAVFLCYGWSIRYFMSFKDNYFGTFTNFSTLAEYMDKRNRGEVGDPVVMKYRAGQSNSFETSLTLGVEDVVVVLPAEIYGCKSGLTMKIPELQVFLRLHDYFMEMNFNVQPITTSSAEDCSLVLKKGALPSSKTGQLVINGIDIMANRLSGPQPHTATYVCVWEIQLGSIYGVLSPELATYISRAATVLGVNYPDDLNAPSAEFIPPVEHDVSFVKMQLSSIDVAIRSSSSALHLTLEEGISLNHSDLASNAYSSVTSIVAPSAVARTLLNSSRIKSSWFEVASVSGGINCDMYSAPSGWRSRAALQVQFVAEQDALTNRMGFVYGQVHDTTPSHLQGLFIPGVVPNPSREKPPRHSPNQVPSHRRESSDESEEDLPSESEDGVFTSSFRGDTPRPSKKGFIGHPYTDGSLSSGDESDNAEDSDSPADSDTDLSDLEDGCAGEEATRRWPKLQEMYHALSRYKDASLPEAPGDSPAFVFVVSPLIRENIPQIVEGQSPPSRGLPSRAIAHDDGVDLSVVRLQSSGPISIFMTPLLVNSVRILHKAVDQSSFPVEHHLDDLFAAYLGKVKTPPTETPSRTVLDFILPSVNVEILQMVEGLPERNASFQSCPSPLTLGTLHVQGTTVMLDQQSRNKSTDLAASFRRLDISVRSAAVTSETNSTEGSPLLVAGIAETSVAVLLSSVMSCHLVVGSVTGTLADSSPTPLMSSIDYVKRSASKLGSTFSRALASRQKRKQTLIREILSLHPTKSVAADPLSWTYTSLLVKSGLPHRLRKDLSRKLLAHMRHCLRETSSPELERISCRLEDTNSQLAPLSDVSDVFGGHLWSNWAHELEGSPLELILFQVVYPLLTEPGGDVLPGSIHMDLAEARAMIGGSSTEQNIFELRPSRIRLQYGTRDQQITIPLDPRDVDKSIFHVVASLTIEGSHVSIYPSVMPFLSHLQQMSTTSKGVDNGVSENEHFLLGKRALLELLIDVRQSDLRASALDVLFNVRQSRFSVISKLALTHCDGTVSVSGGNAVMMDEFSVRARLTKASDQDVLASLFVRRLATHVPLADGELDRNIATVLGVHEVRLNVPRSAIRLYKIATQWQKAYMATYEPMVQGLLARMDRPSPRSAIQELPKKVKPLVFNLQVSFKLLGANLQVMHGTWLTWDLNETLLFARGRIDGGLSCNFGLNFESQIIKLSVHPVERGIAGPSTTSIRLPLPSFKTTGTYDSSGAKALAILGFFSITLKPKFIDDILTVQQHLGNDFNDWLDLYAKARQRTPSTESSTKVTSNGIAFKVETRLEGFRVALEGPSSTQFVDAAVITGELKRDHSPQMSWSFNVTSLALSLAHHTTPASNRSTFDRKYRSAYMVVEFDADNASPPGSLEHVERLNGRIRRVHAVLQAAALSELGDLVDYVQAEMLLRKEQRSVELAGFRNKGQRIMTVLERDSSTTEPSPSWLDNRIVSITVDSVGMALPLRLDSEVMPTRSHLRPNLALSSSSVRAFLFSIHTISFATTRYEKGHAHITDFSFQFVDDFDQSKPAHFEGRNHETRNRVRFPQMSAELRSSTSGTSRTFVAGAQVSGFELDLHPSIANYSFSFVDVYRQGKDRIEKLAPGQARANFESLSSRVASTQAVEDHYLNAVNSSVKAEFTFEKGKVQLFGPDTFAYDSPIHTSYYETPPDGLPTLPGDTVDFEPGVDVFLLPTLNVIADFNALSASQKFGNKQDAQPQSELVVTATVFSSHNTIRPSVLPFAVDLVRNIENRLRHAASQSPADSQIPPTPIGTEVSAVSVISATGALGGHLHVTFSLHIEESSLELTCLPDVNVVAGLKWESGDLVVTIQPSGRQIAISGAIGGIKADLRHGYLREDAVTAEARNLALQLSISKVDHAGASSLTMVVHTEIAAHVAFQRLQDVLCFKAVWLDRIPVFDIHPNQTEEPPSDSATWLDPDSNPQHLTMSVIVRIRSLKVVADLGAYISRLELKLDNLDIVRSQRRTLSGFYIAMGALKLDATEALSGYITIPRFEFKAVRTKRRRNRGREGFNLLEIVFEVGVLEVMLEFERVGLFKAKTAPINCTIRDNWPSSSDPGQAIRLDFTLHSGEMQATGKLRAVREVIGTIGRVKALLKTQKDSAAKESKAFRTTLQPKPENPLSEVASSMLQAARSRFKETEEQLDFTIIQRMEFVVERIQVELIDGQKLSRVGATAITAGLERQVRSGDQAPQRKLQLSLGTFNVSTWSGNGDPQADLSLKHGNHHMKDVFQFPRLEILMNSVFRRELNQLDFEFSSMFPGERELGRNTGLYLVLDWVQYDDLIKLKALLEEQIQIALMDPNFHSRTSTSVEPSDGAGQNAATLSSVGTPMERLVGSKEDIHLTSKLSYFAVKNDVDTPVLRQLGDTKINPGAFKSMTGINVKKSLPVWVHEYATIPIESIMKILLDIYVRRLRKGKKLIMGEESDFDTESEEWSLDEELQKAVSAVREAVSMKNPATELKQRADGQHPSSTVQAECSHPQKYKPV